MPRSILLSRLARLAQHLAVAFQFHLGGRKDKGGFRQRWSRDLLAILGVRIEADALQVAPGTLIVANHVSWLDVFVLSALLPPDLQPDFVAKAEIRRWPLIGWLLERDNALFVNRRVGRHLLRVNSEIEARLAARAIVAFFPEGTTTDGAGLLPFRPALFEPAVRGSRHAQPFALAYLDAAGRRCAAAAVGGEPRGFESFLAIAARPGAGARVTAGRPIATHGLDRREAARRAQAAVQERLCGGSSLPERQNPVLMPAGCSGSASATGIAPSRTAPILAN